MGLTVRFPNGQAVTYNAAHWSHPMAAFTRLSTSKDGDWVCDVPYASGAIIEAVAPCSVTNPIANVTVEAALDLLLREVDQCNNYRIGGKIANLKLLLTKFNARSRCWKK